jgi:hypothetical protein
MLYKGNGEWESEADAIPVDTDMTDEKYLLAIHGFKHPEDWEIAWVKNSIYNVQIKGGAVDTFYASKVTVKPRTSPDPEQMLRHFMEMSERYSPVQPRELIYNKDGKLLLIDITDLHLGQLSWGAETGENYDHKIAVECMKKLINDIIAKSAVYTYDKIVFVIGNDFFNIDNIQSTTTKGTQQFNDVRWQKMFDVGCDVLVWGVEALRQAFPNSELEIIRVDGNHEKISIHAAVKYLAAFFRKDETVGIDTSPRAHKGFAFGNTALLFTHGQNELKNLDWVYTEFRHLIGCTKWTEIHAGHKHCLRVEEKNGAMIYRNPAATAASNYTYENGWNSVRQAVTRIYDKDDGLIHEIYSKV